MRLLVVSALWPHGTHSVRAANIVINEMLSAFAAVTNIELGLLVTGEASNIPVNDAERQGIDALHNQGIDVLPPLMLPPAPPPRPRLTRWFIPDLCDFYPLCAHSGLIEKAVLEWKPDVVLVPWSEWLTHACASIPVRKFAYYGNPDPKGARIRAQLRYRNHETDHIAFWMESARVGVLEKLHLTAMDRYEWMGNVADNDAKYYASKGHPNAFYIQNIWVPAKLSPAAAPTAGHPVKIIGSIGKVNGTANTLGLEYLGTELMPAFDRAFAGRDYEVHIYGAGVAHPIAKSALNHPKIVWRGFVDDIDAEMQAGDVFLCANNATAYKVGHTRYLHAWSLGVPVVAHADASLSMPEIRHGENSLLGRTADEIAENARRVVDDGNLRGKITTGGLRTFQESFLATQVVSAILMRLNEKTLGLANNIDCS
jgi:glycosyltransferase involved in cell wall biosynthesis